MKRKVLAIVLSLGMVFGNRTAVFANEEELISGEGAFPNEAEISNLDAPVIDSSASDMQMDSFSEEETLIDGIEPPENVVSVDAIETDRQEETVIDESFSETGKIPYLEEGLNSEDTVITDNSFAEEQLVIEDISESNPGTEQNDDAVNDIEIEEDIIVHTELMYNVSIMKSDGGMVRFSDRMNLPEQQYDSDEYIADLRSFSPGTEIIFEVISEEGYELQSISVESGSIAGVKYELQANSPEYILGMPEDSVVVTAVFTNTTVQNSDIQGEIEEDPEEEIVNSDRIMTGAIQLNDEKEAPDSNTDKDGTEKIAIETLSIPYEVYEYTGEAIEPEVIVISQGLTLEKDVDYTVTYNNNIEIGTATIIVNGKGRYEGTLTKSFEIIGGVIASGSCGSNLVWELSHEGCLTISGTGNMSDYIGFNYPEGTLSPWCEYRDRIKCINICNGVTSIGEYAFSGCSDLISIILPESITNIGECAFSQCGGLTSIDIPESVTNIGEAAFFGCRSLTSIRIPASVTRINVHMFGECRSLTRIDIPESVTNIGEGAFFGCSSLTSIDILESITSIGGFAFFGCSSLTSIRIPESVTRINNNTFINCSGLTSIIMPQSISSIGQSAFKNCGNLQVVYYEGTKAQWDAISIEPENDALTKAELECAFSITYVLYEGQNNNNNPSVYRDVKEPIVLKDPVRDDYVFCGWFKDAGFTEQITEIPIGSAEDYTLYAKWSAYVDVDGISLDKSTLMLAVRETADLTVLFDPEDATNSNVRWESGNNFVAEVNNGSIIGVAPGNTTITAISEDGNHTAVCTVYVVNADGKCGESAWYQLNGNTLKIFGYGKIDNCGWLTTIPWYNQRDQIQYVEIDEGIEGIGNNAFSGCANLKRVSLPDSLISVGSYAFSECKNLDRVTIPDSVIEIGDYAFQKCSGLSFCVLPENLQVLDNMK